MSDIQKGIERMGFDAEMAHNLSEIVRITREAAIEECAKLIESGGGMADLIDQEQLDQQAKYLRALVEYRPAHPSDTRPERGEGL